MGSQRDNPGWFRSLAYRSPLYALTLGGKVPAALACVPTDPWPGDSARGAALLAGRYEFSGETIIADEPDWSPEAGSPGWRAGLHGFEWLRDLRAQAGDDARRHARMLVGGWIDRNTGWQGETWSPEVLGARISNWIGLHDFFCLSADDVFRARVFDSLARQARHLYRVLPGQAEGAGLIQGIKGLVFAAVALPGSDKHMAAALRLLQRELPRQILPDGGHVERSPQRHLHVLRHLIDIRAALRAGRAEVPDALQHAIDRMTPALRFFRHGDNTLALFNGGQEADATTIDAVLAQSDARGRPLKSMPHTGYERLLAGRTLVLIDVGAAPPPGLDRTAHAGPLAFEFSVGRERVIVNCGAHPAGGVWRRALAATAAHSTVTVAETNAAEVLEAAGLGRRPASFGCERIENQGATLVEASHDGYLRAFGLTHHRRLYLADDGEDMRGEDLLEGPAGHPFALRFHLHPSVQVSLVQSGAAALLRLPSGIGWRLRATGGTIEVAESIYVGQGQEPRRTSQIIVTGTTEPDRTSVKWALRRERKVP
ncbi:heparinase II/III family protein [Arenibaculum pallidiluteum]|uniref:heparinase II/III family protein n=1 Tax=Arenibaculum pallidiluteum TaxID=2812559 RepID=UPI001A95FF6C|nr:heparinase II/III family protein [Arenibaculum pallidiluteum]